MKTILKLILILPLLLQCQTKENLDNDDWKKFLENLLNNKTEIIYSAVAYYLYRLNENLAILNEEDVKVVTKKVNGGTNGLNDRRNRFSTLKNKIYECKK